MNGPGRHDLFLNRRGVMPVRSVGLAGAAGLRLDRPTSRRPIETLGLSHYVRGWAEADVSMIGASVALNYRFYDPAVGEFSLRTLRSYFPMLQERLSRLGAVVRSDVAFVLHGPVDRSERAGQLQFWREAPRIGLTGISIIEIGAHGVVAEAVAYDPSLALDVLRTA